MNSKALIVRTWGRPTSVYRHAEEPRYFVRDRIIAGAVILAHVVGLYFVIRGSTATMQLDGSRSAGQSIQVSLVTAPTRQSKSQAQPVDQPKSRTDEKPVLKPDPPKPHKMKVLASTAPNDRTVAQTQPVSPKPVEAQTPPKPSLEVAPTTTSPQPGASGEMTAVQAPSQLATSKELSAGELKQLGCQIPSPDYPPKAKRLEQSGAVVVAMTIQSDGSLHSVHVARSSGYDSLDDAAVAAVRAGHCHPYMDGGFPRAVTASQGITFGIND
jgi:periplasmic protein TonB